MSFPVQQKKEAFPRKPDTGNIIDRKSTKRRAEALLFAASECYIRLDRNTPRDYIINNMK
jgi:hypothetical protein